jgi:hypothetical protein
MLVVALLTGGGLSLVLFDQQPDLTGLTSARSAEDLDDLDEAESLLEVTDDTTAEAPPTALERVRPVLECVEISDGEGGIAYFGYLNTNDVAVDVLHGRDNGLGADASSGGVPTTFAPGSNRFAFAVELAPGETVIWNLQGRTATASGVSPACQFGAYEDLTLPEPA